MPDETDPTIWTPPSEMEQVASTEGNLSCKYGSPGGSCQYPGEKVCIVCNQPFCSGHASKVDPEFCADCLKPEDASLNRQPLVDDDGVEHKGAHVEESGLGKAYKPMMQRISEMTEDQLLGHIQHYKVLVKEAERVLDYRKIALSAAELQLGDLQAIQRRKKSSGYKVQKSPTGIGFAASTPSTKKSEDKVTKLASVAKDLGLPPDRMKDFILALAQAAKKKPTEGGK